MKSRKEGLRKARACHTPKQLEAERDMRIMWATAGGFLLGAVYGPRLLRLASRGDLPAMVARVLSQGIPEPWPPSAQQPSKAKGASS
jgi:hypothetical protein